MDIKGAAPPFFMPKHFNIKQTFYLSLENALKS